MPKRLNEQILLGGTRQYDIYENKPTSIFINIITKDIITISFNNFKIELFFVMFGMVVHSEKLSEHQKIQI